jgi:hypothetical protein
VGRAIGAPKKKNDRIDSGKIADYLRCDFLPEWHKGSPAIRVASVKRHDADQPTWARIPIQLRQPLLGRIFQSSRPPRVRLIDSD